jgi:hypothetical protein
MSRTQSYDFDLQRQHCKNLQRQHCKNLQRQHCKNLQRNLQLGAFLEQKLFFSYIKTPTTTPAL